MKFFGAFIVQLQNNPSLQADEWSQSLLIWFKPFDLFFTSGSRRFVISRLVYKARCSMLCRCGSVFRWLPLRDTNRQRARCSSDVPPLCVR